MRLGAIGGHPVNLRLLRQNEIHLAGRAIHANVLNISTKVGVELVRVDQPQESPLGVGIGNHALGVNDLVVIECDTRSDAVSNIDLFDRSIRSNFHAKVFACRSHCLRDSAHTSDHVTLPGLLL